MKITIKLHGQPDIEIIVNDTETGRLYFDLCKNQNQMEAPFFQDTFGYTPEYMIELAHQAKKAFNWDWFSDTYDISKTATLHKDLENSVGKLGFDQIPEEYDHLLYELHHCLHAIQFGKISKGRTDNFQIEWFTDKSIPLPASFEFQEGNKFGDLILINPYVGHNPLQIYHEDDFDSLHTTCRFHDIIKPAIVITTGDMITKDMILKKFIKHAPDFVELHGEDKIRYYSGSAVIGKVVDVDVFKQIKKYHGTLVLNRVEFHD
jgi:hypothetical protein